MSKRLTQLQYEERIQRISEGKLKVLTKYETLKTMMRLLCLVCNKEIERAAHRTLYNFTGCFYCNKKRIAEHLKKVKPIKPEIFEKRLQANPLLQSLEPIEPYEKMLKKVKIRCKTCDKVWYEFPDSIYKGKGCSFCNKLLRFSSTRFSHEKFLSLIDPILKEKIEVLSPYIGGCHPIDIRCKICNKKQTKSYANALKNGRGCIFCNLSKGEKRIQQILEEQKIAYQPEFSFPGSKKRFDFAIFNERGLFYLIEYDGSQHSSTRSMYNKSLLDIIKLDEAKNQLAKKHGIPLIRINHTEYKTVSWEMLKIKLEVATLILEI